jgi:hypothetical protein
MRRSTALAKAVEAAIADLTAEKPKAAGAVAKALEKALGSYRTRPEAEEKTEA